MDALERAIRTALQKDGAEDRNYREKVYRSAFAALERAVSAPGVAPENAETRRQNLKTTIATVEREFMASARAAGPLESRPHIEVGPQTTPIPISEPAAQVPVLPPEPVSAPAPERREPNLSPSSPRLDEYRIDADLDERVVGETREVRRRRRPGAYLFLAATLLALAALVWWAIASGFLASSESRDGSVPNPAVIEEEGFEPLESAPTSGSAGSQAGRDADAQSIYQPPGADGVSAPEGAQATPGESDDGAFLKIKSGEAGAAVAFDVASEILEGLAGRRAVFVIDARAEEGAPTQISVICDFGDMGDCGRQRYEVGHERGEFIFDVDLPDRAPGAGGTIAIVSDVANSGKALDLFGIRVSGLD